MNKQKTKKKGLIRFMNIKSSSDNTLLTTFTKTTTTTTTQYIN